MPGAREHLHNGPSGDVSSYLSTTVRYASLLLVQIVTDMPTATIVTDMTTATIVTDMPTDSDRYAHCYNSDGYAY